MENRDYYNSKIKYYNLHKLNEFGNPLILDLIKKESTVFDIGCNTGNLARGLNEKKNCKVYGVDISDIAISEAKKYLFAGEVLNLEDFKNFPFSPIQFDYIVLADVLEHIKNPNEVLKKIKEQLKFNFLIISLPNISFFDIRLKLLMGKFDYQEQGIMDESHLHFYTLKTAKDLIVNNGYKIEKQIPFPLTNRKLAFITHPLTKIFPTFFARQFVFLCSKK